MQTIPDVPAGSSFRDPAGAVTSIDGRVLRFLQPAAAHRLREFLSTELAKSWLREGRIPQTTELSADDSIISTARHQLLTQVENEVVFEHGAIWFPSYPFEWPPTLLYDAAALTLQLAGDLLPRGFGLKDATPFNVMFEGRSPVFLDLASIEERRTEDPIWLAYGQFIRTFVLPLAVYRSFGIPPHESYLSNREGLSAERVYRMCSWPQRLRAPYRSAVTIPRLLETLTKPAPREGRATDPRRAAATLRFTLRHAKRLLGPRPAPARSHWSSYADPDHIHTRAYHAAKIQLLTSVIHAARIQSMLDVGCNTGAVSRAAAAVGVRVVGIDSDVAAVEVAAQASAEAEAFLPLVVDFAAPSPALGWRNSETATFIQRAKGKFELVSMLAVLHHLLVTARLPLREVLRMAREIATRYVLIEFVPPDDPMFRTLSSVNASLYEYLNRDYFEAECRSLFTIEQQTPIADSGRVVYLLSCR